MARPEQVGAPREGGVLAVEVTPDCNRNCHYCYNGWRLHPETREPVLPADELVDLVERALQESGRQALQFSGGEPLLRTDFFTIVERLKAPGRSLSLVTDGGLIDEIVAGRLKELGVAPVQPTLLAADRKVHDRLKGTVGAFDKTITAIGILRNHHVPVAISFVCTRANYHHFQQVVELSFAMGVQNIAFSRFCTAGAGAERQGELQPTAEQVQDCLDVALEAVKELGVRVHMAISLPLCLPTSEQLEGLSFGSCALGTGQPGYTVDPWGKLRACSVSSVTLGDLRRESWSTIVDRAHAEYFPAVSVIPEACGTCALAIRCRGGCRESVRAMYGDLERPDPLAVR
jgi:Fe-coproporphyrin III synthase